ncbi:MAG: IclR family transcriptional regulator [Chloroflexota bacterium]
MQAVERTFAILRVIAHHDGLIGVSRISEHLDLPKSTVFRFLVALEAEGLVTRSLDNRFSLGSELITLTKQRTFHDTLVEIARPELVALNQYTSEAVMLSVLDGQNISYLDHIASPQAVQVVDWTGEVIPLHIPASGKLFLAWQSEQFIETYLNRPLEVFTPQTVVSIPDLTQQLKTIRHQDVALSDEEFALGVIGYAVPIRDAMGTIIAGLTLYGPKFRLEWDAVVPRLKKSSEAIEQKLHQV